MLSKEALKIKALVSVDHFIPSSKNHSSVSFCPILKNWVSKFKFRFSLTNDIKVSDFLVLRIKIYGFKLVYIFLGHPV